MLIKYNMIFLFTYFFLQSVWILIHFMHVIKDYHILALYDLSETIKLSETLFMNSVVVRYWDLVTGFPPLAQRAKSLVISPPLTVSITAFSNFSQKIMRAPFLSRIALCYNPLVQAKIEAIGFVEVSFPFCHSLKCLVTVPWAASDSKLPSGLMRTEVINPRDPYP